MKSEDRLLKLEQRLVGEPENLDLLNQVGVYRVSKSWEGSLLKEVLKRKRTIRSLANYAGYLSWVEQDWDAACLLLEEAIALNPRHDLPELGYGVIQLYDLKRPEVAIPALISAFEKGQRACTLCLLGAAYFDLGKFEESAEVFSRCQEGELRDVGLFGETAARRQLGQISRARLILDRIAHEDSDNFLEIMASPLDNIDIANLYAGLGEFEKAVSCLDKGHSNFDFISGWTLLGKAYFEARPGYVEQTVSEGLCACEQTLLEMADGSYWDEETEEEMKEERSGVFERIECYRSFHERMRKLDPCGEMVEPHTSHPGCLFYGCDYKHAPNPVDDHC